MSTAAQIKVRQRVGLQCREHRMKPRVREGTVEEGQSAQVGEENIWGIGKEI